MSSVRNTNIHIRCRWNIEMRPNSAELSTWNALILTTFSLFQSRRSHRPYTIHWTTVATATSLFSQ